jgi:hypothetical protein
MRRGLSLSLCLLFVIVGAGFGDYPEDVVLTTGQDCYPLRELVRFTIANNGDSPIGTPGTPPWGIYNLATGAVVLPPGNLPMPWTLQPHTACENAWEQIGIGGDPYVGAGFYEIVLLYRTSAGETWYSARDTVEISSQCPPTAVDRRSWGSLKDLFR